MLGAIKSVDTAEGTKPDLKKIVSFSWSSEFLFVCMCLLLWYILEEDGFIAMQPVKVEMIQDN